MTTPGGDATRTAVLLVDPCNDFLAPQRKLVESWWRAILTQMLEESFALEGVAEPEATPYGAIRASNRHWLALCRANAGLMRCVFQLGDEIAEFTRLPQRVNRIWYERVARSVVRRREAEEVQLKTATLAVYMLGAMMDELVRKLVVYPDPDFLDVVQSLGLSDDDLADAASVIWLRVLYPGAEVEEPSTSAAALLARLTAPPQRSPAAH